MGTSIGRATSAEKPSPPGPPLRTLMDAGSMTGLTDEQLLGRFLEGARPAAEAAFALLVDRHGPMVLRVGHDLLNDPHDAEDVFQAVFLVLAQRAGSIRERGAVGCWLHGVARRLSLRLRRRMARRRLLERRRLEIAGDAAPSSTPPADPWGGLHEELDKLPHPFREAVVLCDLEGFSYEQAAGLLGCPVGTLQSRLARGRERLRRRLGRRGLAAGLPLVWPSPPPPPRELSAQVVEAAVGGLGRPIQAIAPASVVELARAELRRPVLVRGLVIAVPVLMAASVAMAMALAPHGRPTRPAQAAAEEAKGKARAGPISVRVVDAEGRGVPGIRVEMTDWELDEPRVLAADAEGYVDIPADASSGRPTLLARVGNDSLAWVEFQASDLQGPAGTHADPVLMRMRPLAHRVVGTVVDRQGQGIAGAEVVAQGLGVGAGGPQAESMFVIRPDRLPSLPRATTDGEGRFEIALPAGVGAHLVAWHPRFISHGMHAEPDARTVAALALVPAGTIAGRVVDADTGRPVPNVRLSTQLIDVHRVFLGGGWGEAKADDQGRFAINGLEPGVYNLLFEKALGRPQATARAVEGLRVRAGQSTAAFMRVIEGRPLRGIVLDQRTRQPVPGIPVGCYGPARPQSGAQVMARNTDAAGAFTFFVPPGEQYVYLVDGNVGSRLGRASPEVPEQGAVAEVQLIRASQPAANQARYMKKAAVPAAEPAPPAKKAPPVALEGKEAAKGQDVERPVTRTIRGWVRDVKGQPLPAVHVQLDAEMHALVPPVPGAQPGSMEVVATDRAGIFELEGMPRVPLKVWVRRPGFNPQPAEVRADRDDVVVIYALEPEPGSKHRPVVRRDDPIPAELRGRLTFADLSGLANEPLADGPGGSGNDLNRLPRGVRNLDGRFFRVGDDMVHLAGEATVDLPQEAKGIKVRARAHRIHFLHAVQNYVPPGTEVGAYVVHYGDGATERIPIVYGRDVVAWWQLKRGVPEEPSAARVAWVGDNDASELNNKAFQVRLFARTWTNPHPDREVATIDFHSSGTAGDPFLVALTAERTE